MCMAALEYVRYFLIPSDPPDKRVGVLCAVSYKSISAGWSYGRPVDIAMV